MVAPITLLAGLFYIILSILKMGWVSNFLAESVNLLAQKEDSEAEGGR